MNKRLKELYLQSHTTRHYDGDPALEGNPPTVYWQGEVSAQRFAELIVQECVEICKKQEYKYWRSSEEDQWTPIDSANAIEQHFGVSE